ncbi:MAG: CDP-diacylglycerol--glycerol-3-phosphate 3-phosphatidyltransferase [Candidatus Rokubacteria bacterium]|nr:CDP-diacylglycerol--glycerol-3-phosphate 3-phosphatidyltransferase [Candidatus Rokubacteria bacterium]
MVNLPIGLTLVRIVLVPLVVVFLISSSRVHVLIAAVIFVAASLTDWLDGLIARRRHQVTTLGKLLDPVADKLLVAAALISLVQINKVPAWMVVVIIGREFAVTGLRGIAASVGTVVPASELAKYKTFTQYVAITLLILEKGVPPEYVPFYWLADAALWVALVLTVVSGIDYFIRFFAKADYDALVRDEERWP